MAKTIFDGNRISSSIMSKPDKIFTEAKKDACYYGIAASSKVRVGSYGTRFVVDWGGQAKTEKAKKTDESVQRC